MRTLRVQRVSWRFVSLSTVLLFCIPIRILFLYTFPASLGGDAPGYWDMLVGFKSNLIHASGYTFLMGLPWEVVRQISGSPITIPAARWLEMQSVIQHTLGIVFLVPLFRLAANIFGAHAAFITTLIYGFHPIALSATSIICPEWLQAGLLILFFYLLHGSTTAESAQKRYGFLVASGVVFAFDFLVKYNALYMVLSPIGAILLAKVTWRQKALLGFVFLLASYTPVWIYKNTFHKRSTLTRTLSHDVAWVLLTRVSFVGKLSPETGVATRRLLILHKLLPQDRRNVFAIPDIRVVSPHIRSYRKKYGWILRASDKELRERFPDVSWDPNFSYFHAFSSPTFYLGYPEGDRLGTQVFVENVRAFPLKYCQEVLVWSVREFLTSNRKVALVPTQVDELSCRSDSFCTPTGQQRGGYYDNPYGYFVWLPGLYVFLMIKAIYDSVPAVLLNVLAVVVWLSQVWRLKQERRMAGSWIRAGLLPILYGFVVFSHMLLGFRADKETVFVLPAFCLMFADAIVYGWRYLQLLCLRRSPLTGS